MESLGNECLATVGPTHDPDASVGLILNECIQLHYFIDWILIHDCYNQSNKNALIRN